MITKYLTRGNRRIRLTGVLRKWTIEIDCPYTNEKGSEITEFSPLLNPDGTEVTIFSYFSYKAEREAVQFCDKLAADEAIV